jgi:very-short-patch-repair endonuclease
LRYDQTYQGRIEYYAKYGYKVLILWEHEILKLPKSTIVSKVQEFMDKSKEG